MARVTFSLDEETVARIRQTAARLRKPQSHVVRDAVEEYAARAGRLNKRECVHALAILERLHQTKPSRPASEVDRVLKVIRNARRSGGRRHGPA